MRSFLVTLGIVLVLTIVFGLVGLATLPFALIGWCFFIYCCDIFHWFNQKDTATIIPRRPVRHVRDEKPYVEMPPIDTGVTTDLYIAQQLARKRRGYARRWW